MKIYCASSWRNKYQEDVVKILRKAGHDVYDFKNPNPEDPDNHGFSWKEIHPNWQQWTVQEFANALMHPVACKGFMSDKDALEWCDLCVLVLPSGMSAHLEAGWCSGKGKRVLVYAPELKEPELMYKLFDEEGVDATPIFETMGEIIEVLENIAEDYEDDSKAMFL